MGHQREHFLRRKEKDEDERSEEKSKGSKEKENSKEEKRKGKEDEKKGKDYTNDEEFYDGDDNNADVVPANVNQQTFVVPKDEDYRKIIIKSRVGDRFDVEVQGV